MFDDLNLKKTQEVLGQDLYLLSLDNFDNWKQLGKMIVLNDGIDIIRNKAPNKEVLLEAVKHYTIMIENAFMKDEPKNELKVFFSFGDLVELHCDEK